MRNIVSRLVLAATLALAAAPAFAGTPAAYLYDEERILVGSAGVNFATDTIIVVPVSSAYTPDLAAHTMLSQVTASEVTTCGGARLTLTGKSWTLGTSPRRYQFKSTGPAPLTWTATGCTLTIKYLVFAKQGASDAASPLLMYIDLDSTSTSTALSATTGSPNGTITATMDATYGWLYH